MKTVTFKNETIDLAGCVFTPADFDEMKQYPAVVVVHPGGGVKEQVAAVYAEKLAQQGFIALTFDASFQGASGGEPRYMEIPSLRVEDVRCAVNYLSTLPFVDSDNIGTLGICAGGGYAVNVAQTELRIKAVAGVSSVDIGRINREGLDGSVAPEMRTNILSEVGKQRTREAKGEPVKYVGYVPNSADEINESTPVLAREAYDYYRTPRAQHPNSTNQMRFISLDRIMAFFPFAQIETLTPRPVLMIAGDKADTLLYSEDAIQKAAEPKELYLVQGATHIDLYDKPQFVSKVATKLTEFFKQNLK